MNLITNEKSSLKTITSIGAALGQCRLMKLSDCRLELHQFQKLNIVHKRMERFFPDRFAEYTKRSRSFIGAYSQPPWWHALKSLYHMADEEDLFGVDWYILEMTDSWDVSNPGGWRENIPETELFLYRLPVALYGFCDDCDRGDIHDFPPLHLMRALLGLEWRTLHGSAAAVVDEYGLGEDIKRLAREANLWEMWERLKQLERDHTMDGMLIGELGQLAHWAVSDSGNPILDRHYKWLNYGPGRGKSFVGSMPQLSILDTCSTHEYFCWTWHPDSVYDVSQLWKAAQRVMQTAEQLTRWCAQSDMNFAQFARFLIAGEGQEQLKAALGWAEVE